MTIEIRSLLEAVVSLLTDGLPQWKVGKEGAPESLSFPYLIVYPASPSVTESNFSGNGPRLWQWSFQVTSVGKSIDQARTLGDKARNVVLNQASFPSPALAAGKIMNREHDAGPLPPIKGSPELFSIVELFRLYIDAG